MRKLLLNPTPLFRKLRQLSMLLTLLLALPLSVFGKGYRTTGNVIDVTGNNAGTLFTWETDATQTTVWRWQIACEASTITPNISTLTFTLPAGKNITLSINGYANDLSTADFQSLRKLILDGLSNDLTVSAYLSKGSDQYNFVGSNGVFTPNNWTQSMSTDGTVYITITNNQQVSVSCTINSITVLTGQIISSNELVWPTDSPISELTKSVSNNVTTLSGNLNVDDTFSFPLKIDNGNTLSNLDSNYDIAYSSSNTNVAEVSGGYVTIKGYGSTTITATLTENDYYSYEQSTYSYTLTNTQTFESYGITVAGTRVTAENANNIFNDGKVVYTHNDDGTGTLTLNGATLTGMIRVSRPEALTIELIGANSITPSDSSAIKADFGTTQTPPTPNLIFKGEGYVTLTPGPTYPAIGGFNVDLTTNGMYAHGSLTTNGTSGSVAKKYNITVGGIQVTSENKNTVLANVSFTPASSGNNNTNTLTLNGASFSGAIESGLDGLTIEFIGANELTGTSGYITSSNNSATLKVKGVTNEQHPTSTLSFTNSSGKSAVEGFANVTLENGVYLKANDLCKYKTDVKEYRKPATIEGTEYNVGSLTYTTEKYYPLWLSSQQFHEGENNNLNNLNGASFDPSTNTLTLNGVSLSGTNGIESGLNSLLIKLKGNNSVYTSTYGWSPITTNVDATLSILKDADNCELTLSGGSSSGAPQMVKGFTSVSLGQGLNFASKTGSTIGDASTKDAIITSATIYPLWVGGTLVTETRTSGTGWSYDNDQKKLTLTNYTKTDNDGHAFISNMANLNVYLVGTNSVGPNSQISTDKAFYTTYTDATLTFSTDENNKGTLSASGYNTFCEGFRTVNGIYCNNGLGYFPGSREIKAKATPTIKFAKRNQGNGDEISPTEYVGADETIQTAIGYVFKAPNPTFDNGYEIFPDSTRYVYSYSVDGVVEFPTTGTNTNNPTRTDYGEINLLKAGTVTITCTFPGNMQNNPCSASYTLKVDKSILILSGTNTTNTACINVDGSWHWGNAPDNYFPAPDITIPNDVTAFSYSSSNTDVATVNSTTGEITPVGPGSATITLAIVDDPKYKDTSYPIDLTVMVPATISFANATASMLNTGTYTQTATTVPTGSTITYSSSNNNVNVDANGQVTISNPSFYGPVTITATVTAVPAANPQYYYVQSNNAAFQATYTLNVAKNFDISSIFTDASMNYATCILSEQLTKPDGLKVYYITGTNGNTVTTQEIDYLPYGIPILLEKTAATIGSVTARTDSSSVVSGNILQYATSNVNTTGSQYILYKNEFVKATGTIPSGKCYLQITTNLPARGVLGIGNDGSTAIEGIDVEATEDEEWYDLQGRRIQKPTKAGIYIKNGKKIVVNNK